VREGREVREKRGDDELERHLDLLPFNNTFNNKR
jgi:hypothetical protein